MARMHTKRHGQSKSHKPPMETLSEPKLEKSKKEIEAAIEGFAKQGMSPAMIGEKLKKEYGVLYIKHFFGKRLVQILKEKKLSGEVPADLFDLMRKAVHLHRHLERHKRDTYNRLRLQRTEAKIMGLGHYYIREKVLPTNWVYDYRQAELLIKGKA